MKKLTSLLLFVFCLSLNVFAQKTTDPEEKGLSATTFSGLKFRSIGPAFMSGRIADIAIDPTNEHIWYVAVGSGGLWKTINAGTTWKPMTDSQSFYSTGCVALDPSNPNTVWLGTGENVGGRHVGIGHGLFVSYDGGQNWENKGLQKTEHISKIIVNPENSNEIWAAAQGPLWSAGGERGLYKTIDGGASWKQVLSDNEWTGVTDVVMDPRNPSILYAATWQRHRNVAAYMGGGEGTALYKSTDGGETWKKLSQGLPKSEMGKIGLAISPINPDVLYAAIELDLRKGAVYRSEDRGMSWQKMSDTVSGGTGPHYYQELVASPYVFDKIYLMNVRVLVSENGGKDFYTMKETNKHSDNHAMVFKSSDPNYILVGTDGGLYETFDDTKNWKFVNNLPLTQFYKLAVDDSYPFYNIYGGTQDNNTQGGPSRTLKTSGISNADWFVLLGGDGHQPATEPGNPDIVYAQSQQGNLHRVDRTTGEAVYIRPQNGLDESYERFNWDAPILVSHHDPKRIYFGSQRVWRSDNRGDSWQTISKDLTLNQERLTLPIMGKQQSWDAAWDVYAMSTYNTITSLSESPLDENILFAGTDDGRIQYTQNGGNTWKLIPVNKLPNVPKTAFVNDIKTDLHDVNTVYVALDNHKFGDYKPYLLKSTNGGTSWKSITNGIPDNTFVWRLVQDHVNPNLLFLATEYGIYVSVNQGDQWIKFSSGLPTISFRDLAIQKRENDLVAASFGRSFYVLDDYSALRSFTEASSELPQLFSPRKAHQYEPINGGTSSQGSSFYNAQNPDYGAMFTYYLPESHQSKKAQREKSEQELKKNNKDIPFPGWSALDEEKNEFKATVFLEIRDADGQFVNKIYGEYTKGFHRVSWNLKKPLRSLIDARKDKEPNYSPEVHVAPGTYSVGLFASNAGEVKQLSKTQTFEVERIRKNVLQNPFQSQLQAYTDELEAFVLKTSLMWNKFEKASQKVKAFERSLSYVSQDKGLEDDVKVLRETMLALQKQLSGSPSKSEVGEKDEPSLWSRLSVARRSFYGNTYGPTPMHRESFEMAKTQFGQLLPQLSQFIDVAVPNLEKRLIEAGIPAFID